MNGKVLELIKLVDSKYNHIQQLYTLIEILEEATDRNGGPMYDDEVMVAKTTYNSHYGYRTLTEDKYKNPDNHIDMFMDKNWEKIGHIAAINNPKLANNEPTKA